MAQTPEINPQQVEPQESLGELPEADLQQEREIEETTGTHVRYKGDPKGLWHTIVVGGETVPDIYIGPGPSPGPHVIG